MAQALLAIRVPDSYESCEAALEDKHLQSLAKPENESQNCGG